MTDLRKRLFEAMRNDIRTMSEYSDNENELYIELETASDDIIDEYEKTFLSERGVTP